LKDEGIQWVIDALAGEVVKKRARENHKYDEVRADQDISWCPSCKRKWEVYDGELWASLDKKTHKETLEEECATYKS